MVLEIPSANVVLITALAKERDAVLKKLNNPTESTTRNRIVHYAHVESKTPDTPHHLALLCLNDMGNTSSAIAATQALDIWNPDQIILVGIAAGRQVTDQYLGDVIVAEQIVNYELGKQERHGVDRRYQVYRPGKKVLDAARSLQPKDWALSVQTLRPDGTSGRTVPRVHFGVVASGEKVVKDPDLVRELADDWVQLIGLEMEGAGVAAAAYARGSNAGVLLVKGVCDWADPHKNDAWQAYAADAAATFVLSTLHSLSVIPAMMQRPTEAQQSTVYSGRIKIDVCNRLGLDWRDLADYFEIPRSQRARFTAGREAQELWEWLEDRKRLNGLKDALAFIGRDDLTSAL